MAKIQGLATTGPLHIISASAGVIAASAIADELIIENSSHAGISIFSGTTSVGVLAFGTSAGSNLCRVGYDHNTKNFEVFTDTVKQFAIDGDGNVQIGATFAVGTAAKGVLAIGLDTSPSAAVANGIMIGSKDSSVGSTDATLELWLETAAIAESTWTVSHTFPIWINGVEYLVPLDAV